MFSQPGELSETRDVSATGWSHGDGADLPLPNVIPL